MDNKDESIILASKCFCGRNLYINEESAILTCGSKDCDLLAKQFGSVSNWLVSNVHEMGKEKSDRLTLNSVELKIVKFLNSIKVGVSQKKIAHETGLAKSTVSKSLVKLTRNGIVIKNSSFYNEEGEFSKKGKSITLYTLDTE